MTHEGCEGALNMQRALGAFSNLDLHVELRPCCLRLAL